MFVRQAQPGSDSPFHSGVHRAGAQTELGNRHLATGHLVNPAQPCLGQGQPRHPWDLPQQATTQGCLPQAMAKSYLLSYTGQLFCDFSSSCRDFVFWFFYQCHGLNRKQGHQPCWEPSPKSIFVVDARHAFNSSTDIEKQIFLVLQHT